MKHLLGQSLAITQSCLRFMHLTFYRAFPSFDSSSIFGRNFSIWFTFARWPSPQHILQALLSKISMPILISSAYLGSPCTHLLIYTWKLLIRYIFYFCLIVWASEQCWSPGSKTLFNAFGAFWFAWVPLLCHPSSIRVFFLYGSVGEECASCAHTWEAGRSTF